MSKIPEVDFDNMTCYELMGMMTSDDRCEEVVKAVRDTKLSIARELYDLSREYRSLAIDGLDTDTLYHYWSGAEVGFKVHANEIALEALGWEGL